MTDQDSAAPQKDDPPEMQAARHRMVERQLRKVIHFEPFCLFSIIAADRMVLIDGFEFVNDGYRMPSWIP